MRLVCRVFLTFSSLALGCSFVLAQHTMVMHSHQQGTESICSKGWDAPIPLFSTEQTGKWSHPVTTNSIHAQAYFDQALAFYYGFDTISAMRSFHQATVKDPLLAMGYWGVALAAGGDLNIPVNDPCMTLAIKQSELALKNQGNASADEKLYIDAISKRYGTDSTGTPVDRDPQQLSVPYMLAMRNVYDKLFTHAARPDPDADALYVVSLMNLRPWLWWTTSGTASNEIQLAIAALESGLKNPAFSHHLGLNHFYVHAMEEAPISTAIRARAAANLLMNEAPERLPHLRHMPAHIYLLAGDWENVVKANQRAVEADQWWVPPCRKSMDAPDCNPLLVGHYMSHDMLFLGVGYSNQGLWNDTRDLAERTEANAYAFIDSQHGLEHYLTTRAMMAIHFGQWDYLASIPPPQSSMPDPHSETFCTDLKLKLASAIWYFGRTMVDAERGQSTVNDLFAFNRAATCATAANVGWGNNGASSILAVVHWRLLSRIALKQGSQAQAIEFARLAAEMEDLLDYDEPPGWYEHSRNTLGGALILAGDPKQALTVFNENLTKHPNDSLSLFGKWQALVRLKSSDAPYAEHLFRKQWRGTVDPRLDDM